MPSTCKQGGRREGPLIEKRTESENQGKSTKATLYPSVNVGSDSKYPMNFSHSHHECVYLYQVGLKYFLPLHDKDNPKLRI